jgi:hypothetical protein
MSDLQFLLACAISLTFGWVEAIYGDDAGSDAGSKSIVVVLLDLSADADEAVRLAAFSALARQPTTDELVSAFRRGLDDTNCGVQRIVLQELIRRRKVADDMLPRVVLALSEPSTADAARKYLLELGEDAVPALLTALEEKEPRLTVVNLLGDIKLGTHRQQIVSQLMFLVKDQDGKVRVAVVNALGKLADPYRDIDPRRLRYYEGLVRMNDANGDGVLTENEWKSLQFNAALADKDQDGQVTPRELASFSPEDKEGA